MKRLLAFLACALNTLGARPVGRDGKRWPAYASDAAAEQPLGRTCRGVRPIARPTAGLLLAPNYYPRFVGMS